MELRDIPKTELHCHLEGIVDPEILDFLESTGKHQALSSERFRQAYPVRTFDEFIRWCQDQDHFEGDILGYSDIFEVHISKLKKQNVIYTEVMFAPGELPKSHDAALKRMDAFRHLVDTFEEGRIQVEFLATISRQKSPEQLRHLVDRILLLHEAGLICGVCMAGLEPGFPIKPFRSIFAKFKEAGLGISIHAGEWCGPESVRDALYNGFPDRIGHGVRAFEDPELIDYISEHRVHLEFCPTSNVRTGSLKRIEDHPIARARDRCLEFSLSTDDPGAFESTVEGEYDIAREIFGFSENELCRIAMSGLRARFQQRFRHPGTLIFPEIISARNDGAR